MVMQIAGCIAAILATAGCVLGQSVPDKLVVLTFDDSALSHYNVVRPILKEYGFGATFFITEGFDFRTNKKDYMTWQQIRQLHDDGFEIGNHTRDHLSIGDANLQQLDEQLRGIEEKCAENSIPEPVTFAWPGNSTSPAAFEILRQHGILFARRGGAPEYPYDKGRGFAYEPGLDHPMLVPSAGDARPNWSLADFERAVQQAKHGKIAVLQFHGTPDSAHSWVNTPRQQFESYMKFLSLGGYQVIAMRDLAKFVDADVTPVNPMGVIEDRQAALASGSTRDNFRRPKNDDDLKKWLQNMLAHGFDRFEMAAALGLTPEKVDSALESLRQRQPGSHQPLAVGLQVLPYPGGRHPRISFLDGAIRPQRETKFSVFPPWEDGGYVVADTPEAIWWRQPAGRELLYLAHTHIPTSWDKQGVALEPLEWEPQSDGTLAFTRQLPGGISFGAIVKPGPAAVQMELWITNGSQQTLRDLRVQNCVMLKAAKGFTSLNSDNQIYSSPYVAVGNQTGKRWVITAWENCIRTWGNPHCPCLHSDPQFPDCEPGQTQRLHGWLSFYEGTDVVAEFSRLEALEWR